MKKIVVAVAALAVVVFLVAGTGVVLAGGARALGLRANGAVVNEPVWGSEGRGRGLDKDRVVQPLQGASGQEPEAHEWVTVSGVVVEGTEADTDISVETEQGTLVVGLGPTWLAKQGFQVRPGDRLTIRGYEEDGEFKAAEITRESDGATITLRDQDGRPAWAGQGRGRGGGLGGRNGGGGVGQNVSGSGRK